MNDQRDPRGAADIWHHAADMVAALRRNGPDGVAGPWNEAIGRAEALLRNEADDVLFMARMAHLLVVGNTATPGSAAAAG